MRKALLFSFITENDKLSQIRIKIRVCGHSLQCMHLNYVDNNIKLFTAEGSN